MSSIQVLRYRHQMPSEMQRDIEAGLADMAQYLQAGQVHLKRQVEANHTMAKQLPWTKFRKLSIHLLLSEETGVSSQCSQLKSSQCSQQHLESYL